MSQYKEHKIIESMEKFIERYNHFSGLRDVNNEEFMVASWCELFFVTVDPETGNHIHHKGDFGSMYLDKIINSLHRKVTEESS